MDDLSPPVQSASPPPEGGYPPRFHKLLDALAWTSRLLKLDSVDRSILAWRAGQSPNSSGFEKTLGAMRTAGLITYPEPGTVALTAEGAALAVAPASPPTKAQLRDAIKEKLPPRHCRMLDALWGQPRMTRAALAEKLGVSAASSGFEKDLGRMRTLGLADYPAPGFVVIGPIFGDS